MHLERILSGAVGLWLSLLAAHGIGQQADSSAHAQRSDHQLPVSQLSLNPAGRSPLNLPGYTYGRRVRGVFSNVNQSASGANVSELEAEQPLRYGRPYGRRFRGIYSNVNQSAGGVNTNELAAEQPLEFRPVYGRRMRGVFSNINQSAGGINTSELESEQPLEFAAANDWRVRRARADRNAASSGRSATGRTRPAASGGNVAPPVARPR